MIIKEWLLFLEKIVGDKQISSYDEYVNDMGKSLDDKLFFIRKVNFDVIVDFGCANGLLLSKIKKIKPGVKIIGYDLDDGMLQEASKNLLGTDALLTNKWEDVLIEIKNYKNPLLNLSSVIHEVYSYTNSNNIKKFWDKQVFGDDFKTIVIRDMIPSVEIHRRSEIIKYEKDIELVKKIADPYYLKSFEERWGIIDDNYRTFVHFLLKYRYIDNWEREVNENYLPVSLETVKKKIPNTYSIIYEDDFVVPFINDQLKKDFGIEIQHSTHSKLIISNNSFTN